MSCGTKFLNDLVMLHEKYINGNGASVYFKIQI